MFIGSIKEWHRFWQRKRKEIPVVCIPVSLLNEPLFGKIFDKYEFFDRVLKNYDGLLIVLDDSGYFLVSRKYLMYVPKHLGSDKIISNVCKNDKVNIQLLFDTLLNRFIKEV